MGPDGSVLVGKRVVRWIVGRERSDAPTTPHVGGQEPAGHVNGALRFDDMLPEQVAGVGRDRCDGLLVTVESECVGPDLLAPEGVLEALGQMRGFDVEPARPFREAQLIGTP